MKEYRFRVANMDCENDAARLRRTLESDAHIELLQLLASSGTVRIAADEAVLSQTEIEAKLADFGFPVQSQREPVGPAPFWETQRYSRRSCPARYCLSAGCSVTFCRIGCR